MKSQLQKLIPKRLQIHKETIDDLTEYIIEPKYYISVEDYYKINETVNDLISALNIISQNTVIKLNGFDTLTTSIQDVITGVPVITAINNIKVEGIVNVDILTSFYINGKKYQYNQRNRGNVFLGNNYISGSYDPTSYVSSVNGQLRNVQSEDMGVNENHITGGISGIQINEKVYYPFSTYFWNTSILAIPTHTSGKFNDKIIALTNQIELPISNIFISGQCNSSFLKPDYDSINRKYKDIVLSSRILSSFKLDVFDDYSIPPFVSASLKGTLADITYRMIDDGVGEYIEGNIRHIENTNLYEFNGYYLTEDMQLTSKVNITQISTYYWNNQMIYIPPYTSAIINNILVEITGKDEGRVTTKYYKYICNDYVLVENLVLSTSYEVEVLSTYYWNKHITTIPPYTSAYVDLVILTEENRGHVDWNLLLKEKNLYLTGDVELYKLIDETSSYIWNSTITSLSPYTSAIVDFTTKEITNFYLQPVTNIVISGIISYNNEELVLDSNTPLTTTFNGFVDLHSILENGNYVKVINGDNTKEQYNLLSTITYNNRLYTQNNNHEIRINNNLSFDYVTFGTHLEYYTPLTLSSAIDLNKDNEKSALNLNQLNKIKKNDIIRVIQVWDYDVTINSNQYPLHFYDQSGNYISSGIISFNNNVVTLSNRRGTLTVMKIGVD